MHIPDGFLDAKTALTMGALSAGGLGLAMLQTRRHLPQGQVARLGLCASFVFSAQMLNFPVIGGTSGHLIGGVLAAVLMGPSAAVLVITTVLLAQCMLFADGGITALGANIFNLALVGGVGGWLIYRTMHRLGKGRPWQLLSAGIAAWASTVLASIACAGELAASGTVPWIVALPAMAGVHMLIGLGEALITMLILASLVKAQPTLLSPATALATDSPTPVPVREPVGSLVCYGLLVSLGLALLVSPFASPWPDGLDKVAQTHGFHEMQTPVPVLTAPVPDYQMPGISAQALATSAAGSAGTLVVFALAWLLARSLTWRAHLSPTVRVPMRL